MYVLTFLDDHINHGWVTFLKDKLSTYGAWQNFLAMVKTQYKKDVRAVMTNLGGEFTSLKITDLFKESGIKIFHSVAHMHQQNGHAEHFNRTLFEKAEAMQHHTCLPKSWWEFCVQYTVYVYNRTPIARTKTTPYESVNRIKPDISHLHVMGCAAYVFLHEDQCQNKMSPHTELMTFIGFTDGMKGWKFMKSTNTVFHATQAVFDKSTFLHCPGSRASILAIETRVLDIDKENIPSEDVDTQQAPPAVEADLIWLHGGGYPYIPDNIVPGGQLPPGDPPVSPPSPSMSYTSSSRRGPLPPSQGSGSKAPSQRLGSRQSGTSSGGSSTSKQAPPSGGSSRY